MTLTFLHGYHRLHTGIDWKRTSETYFAAAGLMIGEEREGGGISRIELGISSDIEISGSEFSSLTPDLNSDQGSWKK